MVVNLLIVGGGALVDVGVPMEGWAENSYRGRYGIVPWYGIVLW